MNTFFRVGFFASNSALSSIPLVTTPLILSLMFDCFDLEIGVRFDPTGVRGGSVI